MKYIKLFETFTSNINPDLLNTFPGIIPATDGLYSDTNYDDKVIKFAKQYFTHLNFKEIIDRKIINGVVYLTLIFTDNIKNYKSIVKCDGNNLSFISSF